MKTIYFDQINFFPLKVIISNVDKLFREDI